MGNDIIIHIGLHKTGTTFLQREYFPHLQEVDYLNAFDLRDFGKKDLNHLTLVSFEGLSGYPWNKKWIRGIKNSHHWFNSFEVAVENVKTFFPDAKIIVVFRKHGELLLSLYKQYIQEGGILKFKDFYGTSGVIRPKDLCFRERIEILKEHFSRVDILSFEKFKEDGVGYFDEYFRMNYGIRKGLISDKKKLLNTSISGKKLDITRKMNIGFSLLPNLLRKFLFKIGMTPRKIMQGYLRHWKSPDSETILRLKTEINHLFQQDWQFVEDNAVGNNKSGRKI